MGLRARRRKPAKLHADKAYDQPDLRRWVRDRGIAVRIARKGIESSQKLGRHHWVIERTMAWLTGYRRLTLRYERKAGHFLAFLLLGAALTCYKRLHKLTTLDTLLTLPNLALWDQGRAAAGGAPVAYVAPRLGGRVRFRHGGLPLRFARRPGGAAASGSPGAAPRGGGTRFP